MFHPLKKGRSAFLFVFLFSMGTITAQQEHIGCHFRSPDAPAPRAITAAERSAIEAVIARSDTFDILHYHIDIDLRGEQERRIRAVTTIDVKARIEGRNNMRFDLVALTVDSVLSAGVALPFQHVDGHLDIVFPHLISTVDTTVLAVYYQGVPSTDPQWGGFRFESGLIYNLGIGISTLPPNFGKVWYPCFDSFVERATYTYRVRTLPDKKAHCHGTMLAHEVLNDGSIVRTFHLDRAIPTHISAIAAANYVDLDHVHTGAFGDVPVRLTCRPNETTAMQNAFVNLGNSIDCLEHWYGPYGWERVGYVITGQGALEIPGNVAYPAHMLGQSEVNNRRLHTHELGHHWWGDVVTPRTHNDMWIKEGPAEYSAHLLEEWIGGELGLKTILNQNMYRVLSSAHVQDEGFQPMSPMPDPHVYGIHTYNKGAAVMHNMRAYLGDSLFRVAMHRVQEEYTDRTLSAEELREALMQVTAADLVPFFRDHIFAPGFSVFVIDGHTVEPEGAAFRVQLALRQLLRGTDTYHDQVPLDITFVAQDGTRDHHTVMVGGETMDLELTAPFRPALVLTNGRSRLNQARIDTEVIIGTTGSQFLTLPNLNMNMYRRGAQEAVTVRLEHIWAGPVTLSTEPSDASRISDSHYWRVESVNYAAADLFARFEYTGTLATDLDNDLHDGNEADVFLFHRARPSEPWRLAPYQVPARGLPTDGRGTITVDTLLQGEYVLGKVRADVAVDRIAARPGMELFPNPASTGLTVQLPEGSVAVQRMELIAADGRAARTFAGPWSGGSRIELALEGVTAGQYIARAIAQDGTLLAQTAVQVIR